MGVRLSWSPRVIGDSQKIYRSTERFSAQDLPTPLVTLGASARTYDDQAAVNGVRYYYAVAAVSGAREALSELATVVGGETVPIPTDPQIDDVIYVNNTWPSFADQSPAARTVTLTGSPAVDSVITYNGEDTASFDGTDGIVVDGTSSTASIANADDFTWEAIVRVADTANTHTIIAKRDSAQAEEGRLSISSSSGKFRFDTFVSGSIDATVESDALVPLDTWRHVAVVRDSGTYSMFVDGEKQAATATGATPSSNSQDIYIGDNKFTSGRRFVGNMGPVRITHGTARYSGAFTPPSSFPLTGP